MASAEEPESAPQPAADESARSGEELDEVYEELFEEAPLTEEQEREEQGREHEDRKRGILPPILDPDGSRVYWDRGLRIERNDGWHRLKIGGRAQLDAAVIHGDKSIRRRFDTGFDYEVRRLWLEAAGILGTRLIYKAQVDLTGNSSGDDDRGYYLRQIYVGYTAEDSLNGVRVGISKEPFTMDDTQSNLTSLFMERALPMAFAPSYNLGVLLNGQALEKRLAWWIGGFKYIGSDGTGRTIDVTTRVTGLPLTSEDGRRLLHLGASYSHQFRDDFELRYRRRPEAHLADRYVDTGRFSSEDTDLYGAELAGKWGPASFQGEFVGSYSRRSIGTPVTFWGGYLQAGYLLTGESRPYRARRGVFGRLQPRTSFDWKAGSWGAWELAARVSYLDLNDREIRGGVLADYALGVNWYLEPHMRVMANLVHADRRGIGRSNIFQLRFQIDY